MARPIKNNADYFTHDKDMRNDPKLRAVRARFGNEGYAIWCYILECLTNADRFKIEWNELSIELLSGDFSVDSDRLSEAVNYMVRLKLLTCENEFLTCENLQRRLQPLIESRDRKRAWEEGRKIVSDVKNPVSDGKNINNDAQSTQSKGEESKVKERRVEESKEINKKEKNAHEREAENFENEMRKGEGSKEKAPPDSAPPPQGEDEAPTLGDQVMSWAKRNRKSILEAAREAGLLAKCETGEDAAKEVQNAIQDFCSYHADQQAFQIDPILQFKEKYKTWFRLRVERRSAAGKKAPPKKATNLICYAPNQCADFFRSRHGELAEHLTQGHKLKLSQCKTNEELSQAMEQVYEILKASVNGNARRGPVDLGSAITASIPVQP